MERFGVLVGLRKNLSVGTAYMSYICVHATLSACTSKLQCFSGMWWTCAFKIQSMCALGSAFFLHITLVYPHVVKPGQKELCMELRCREVACITATQVNLNLSLNSNTKIPFWLKYLYTNFKYHTSSLMCLTSIRNKTRVSRRNFSLSFPLECWKCVPPAECKRCNIGASQTVTFFLVKWFTCVRLLVPRLFSVGSSVRKALSRHFKDLNLLANLQTLHTSNYPWKCWVNRKYTLPQKMLILLLNFLCILKAPERC